jgi:hypothetical protein
MNIVFHYESAEEERQHSRAIHDLAQKLSHDENRVRLLYEEELSRLQRDAKVKNFLTIFAARQVLDSFRGQRLTPPATAQSKPF